MAPVESTCPPRVLDVLVNKVHRHLGPDFSGARRDDLLRRLKLLAFDQAISDLPAWLETLAFTEWNAAQVQALTPVFTVGETYFRRDATAFDWLARQHLAPLLAQRRRDGRRILRVWSAACCTGEEAYSLLFLLDELVGADGANWALEVCASDLNAEFLARAEQACYGQNAFRRNDEAFRSRYFEPEERHWRVRSPWRGRIRFIQHNLVSDAVPCPEKGLDGFDLILCRNVLMYFSPERSASVLQRLLACLTPPGLLLLSAVEAGIASQAGLKGFWAGGNYALAAQGAMSDVQRAVMINESSSPAPVVVPSKAVAKHTQPVVHPSTAALAESLPPTSLFPGWPALVIQLEHAPLWARVCQAQAAGEQGALRQALLEYLSCTGLSQVQRHQICLLLAHSWADRHASEEAEEWLQRALALDPCSAPSFWLQALLAEQNGALKAAQVALQKALYLDPDFILAHFHQARLLRLAGQVAASGKTLQVCRQLLTRQQIDALVPFADGLSCGQLLRLCEQLQEEGAPCSNP